VLLVLGERSILRNHKVTRNQMPKDLNRECQELIAAIIKESLNFEDEISSKGGRV